MISLEEAQERLKTAAPDLGTEHIPLGQAVGRYASENLASKIDLPRFDNSAMDGYAVRADDLKTASASQPRHLQLIGRAGAGDEFQGSVTTGSCVRIFTGSVLPAGADAVVMQEDVTVEGERIRYIEPVKPFENIRLRGEDIRAGSVLIESGAKVTPLRATLLAATGTAELLVRRRPSVALMATGNELREPGRALGPGEIYESNRVLLAALLREVGIEPAMLPIVPDDLAATTRALGAAFEQHDIVLSTGGVSVGELDFVKDAFKQLGGELGLWKVAIRPGKPFVFGRLGPKLLCGLPGNPVSALVTFLLLVRPAILKAQGAASIGLPAVYGQLVEPVSNRGDRRHFARVRWEAGKVRVAGKQASHLLGALGGANGLIDLAPGQTFEAGQSILAHLWQLPE